MHLPLLNLRVLPLVMFVATLAAPVAAQEVGRAEVSAGWKMLRTFDEDEEQTFAKGWYVDLATNLNDYIAIVNEVAGAYRSVSQSDVVLGTPVTFSTDVGVHSFMSGVRFNIRTPRVVPFAQALVGLGRIRAQIDSVTAGGQTIDVDEGFSVSAWLIDVGGGININLSRRLGVRVGVSYMRDNSDVAEDGNSLRVGAGVVIPF